MTVTADVVDACMMLLAAVFSAGIHSTLLMIVLTGAMPLLAIATVTAIDGGVRKRGVWSSVTHRSELQRLAGRLRGQVADGR